MNAMPQPRNRISTRPLAMKKTLYDILEIDAQASPEAIHSAYARISVSLDPVKAGNADNEEAIMLRAVVRDAYFILGDPKRRADYDEMLAARETPPRPAVAMPRKQPFWTPAHLVGLCLILTISGWGFWHNARAREAAHHEVQRLAQQQEAERRAATERQQKLERARAIEQARLDELRRIAELEQFRRDADRIERNAILARQRAGEGRQSGAMHEQAGSRF